MAQTIRGVMFDVDGTLVDSNDAHADAWVDALTEAGHDVAFADVRALIGKGGDKVLPELIGVQKDSPPGKQLSDRRAAIFHDCYIDRVRPFRGVPELLHALRDREVKLAVATSAQPDELKPLLKIAGADGLFEETASSEDVERSKPDPDIVQAALDRLGLDAGAVLMVGDTPYDVEAASRAGVRTVALRCGGWGDADLGPAAAIYDDPADMLAHLDEALAG